jgi:hypothetical protein
MIAGAATGFAPSYSMRFALSIAAISHPTT